MVKKYIFQVLSLIATSSFFSACNGVAKENESVIEEFTVIKPLVTDTFFFKEYVSDITSLNNVELRSRVKGYIEKILVDEGKQVRKGEVLFLINDVEYKEEVLKATANLKSVIAEAKSAELQLNNVQMLVEKNVVSKTEYEMAQSKLDALKAKIEEAKAHEGVAKLKLSYTKITAPFDGIINRITYKTGSLVDEGTLLTTLSDNSEVFAYFNVSESEYIDYTQDKSLDKGIVTLVLANGEEHISKGKIETLEGEVDRSSGNIAFRARFPNPNKLLKNGSSGKIKVKKEIKNAVIIPQKSTFELQDRICIYTLTKKNTVKTTQIHPKHFLKDIYVVSDHLDKSTEFVFEGVQNLRDEIIIKPNRISSQNAMNSLH